MSQESTGLMQTLVWLVLKLAAFAAVMLLIGKRLLPRLLWWIAQTGSQELFRLGVIAVAIGVAFGAAKLFDVSFALGAFFAGMMLRESDLSHRAAEESLPLRDAFAVLFFVSVGMLFDPAVVWQHPFKLLIVVLVIVLGKTIAAVALVMLFGYPLTTAFTVAAGLAQIGEFSFYSGRSKPVAWANQQGGSGSYLGRCSGIHCFELGLIYIDRTYKVTDS